MGLKMLKQRKGFILTIVFLIVCIIIASFLIYVADKQLLENAQMLGEDIANNLVTLEEKSYISNYKDLLKSMSEEINNTGNINIERTEEIYNRFKQITSLNKVDMYVVKNNRLYIYNDEIKESFDNYKDSEWYSKAINSNGEMEVTDIYENSITKEKIISFVTKTNSSNDVISLNLYIDQIANWPGIENLPEGARYYVCDSQGNAIHIEMGSLNYDKEKLKDRIYDLFKGINEGKYAEAETYLIDENGEKRGVYYAQTSTDWSFIITIPFNYLLRGTDSISFAYFGAISIFIILIIYLIITERNSNKKQELYNRITKALGDAYYALYLIDLKKGTYAMLKGSAYMTASIPKTGNYDLFMNCIETIIEKEAYEEFKDTFSISNMQKLVNKNVKSFGGDFKRILNNQERWFNMQMLYDEKDIKDKDNEVVLAFRDINDEKERELEQIQIIRDSMEATELAVKSRNTFFANMSHDMRTPLNAIINLSNLSKEQVNNREKLIGYLDKINISSRQLLDIINNILEVSKMEEGIDSVTKIEFDIEKLLKETLSIFEEEAKIQNKKFKVIYNIKNKYVLGDWGKVRQIVNNLVSNALKYTLEKGNIVVEVTELEGKFISKYELLVCDDGIGMSKEFMDKIYTPFARETRFNSEKIVGTGLGMAVVNNNIQKLNGQIEIKSEPNKGTIVKATIPLEIRDEISETNNDEENRKKMNIKGRKILVVEDNELNMDISTEILEMQGVIVTKARNGQEAVDIFKQSKENTFDAILMDIQMPILDGCEATKQIRRLPRKDAKIIPIIATTANTFAEDIINTQKAGMNDHISKPIDFIKLEKLLSQYLMNKND